MAEPVGNMKTYKLGYLDKDSEIYKIVDGVETVESFR